MIHDDTSRAWRRRGFHFTFGAAVCLGMLYLIFVVVGSRFWTFIHETLNEL